MNPEEERRLPIFESVESDWFRRSRLGGDVAVAPTRPAETTWSSPADEGWRAAEVAYAPVSDGLTAAGLPLRVPKANLVPGRAGVASAAGQPAPAQPAPARSAEQLQARLASFQRAVKDARAAAQAEDAVPQAEDAAAQAEDAEEEPGQPADLSGELTDLTAHGGLAAHGGPPGPPVLGGPARLPASGGSAGLPVGVTPSAWPARCWRRHTRCPPRRSRCRRRRPAAGCRPVWRRKPRPGTAPRCR